MDLQSQPVKRIAAKAIWETGLYNRKDMARVLRVSERDLHLWAKEDNWPSREDVLSRELDPVLQDIRSFRRGHVMSVLEQFYAGLDKDIALLETTRENVERGVEVGFGPDGEPRYAASRPKEVREYLDAKSKLQDRITKLLDLPQLISVAENAQPGQNADNPRAVNVNVITSGPTLVKTDTE